MRLAFLVLCGAFSVTSVACDQGFTDYEGTCFTTNFVAFMKCVELTGGNKSEVAGAFRESAKKELKGEVSANILGKGGTIKGGANAEKAIATDLATRYFPSATKDCADAAQKLGVDPAAKPRAKGATRTTAGPRSCLEAIQRGVKNLDEKNGDGLYEIFPDAKKRVVVWCDMTTDGGGWVRVGEDQKTCGRDSFARSDLLNERQLPVRQIRVLAIRGATWCSGEKADFGWGCSYNFAIRDDHQQYLYDGRQDRYHNSCRKCNYPGFIWHAEKEFKSKFEIVDPENLEQRSIEDNGCTAGGLVYSVWIR